MSYNRNTDIVIKMKRMMRLLSIAFVMTIKNAVYINQVIGYKIGEIHVFMLIRLTLMIHCGKFCQKTKVTFGQKNAPEEQINGQKQQNYSFHLRLFR